MDEPPSSTDLDEVLRAIDTGERPPSVSAVHV